MVTAPAGILFTLKDVAYSPKAPRMKQPFTIKGHIDLFGITFYGPLWVIASVTYPQQWWEVVGSPVMHEMSMAIGGDFEIKYGTGFDREGEYSLIVRVYAGPTISAEAGPVKTMTLPPFPAAATYEAKFTVSGEVPPEGKQYEPGQPSISPATVYEGSKVTISIPVTSKALVAESVVVSCTVTYGSALPGPGKAIRTYTSAPTQMSPGKTQAFSFEHTEVAPNDGKRDIVFEATVGGLTKGYNHFDDAYTVKTMVTAFTFSQPTINGQTSAKVTAGVPITIICPVISKSSTSLTLKARIEIYQGSGWVTPGDLVDQIPIPQFTIAPNATANLKATLTADNAVCPKDIRVFLLRLDDSEIGKSQLFANAYSVEAPTVGFQLGQPTASVVTAQPGQNVTITCPVANKSSIAQTVDILVEIKQAGFSWMAGPTIGQQNYSATIPPNGTYNAVINHTAATGGPTDAQGRAGRHVAVTVKIGGNIAPNTAPNNPNEFDNVFYVQAGVPPSQYTLTINVQPYGTGSVVKSPDKSVYAQGESVALVAQPASGYDFDYWSGDASGNYPNITVSMTGNKSVVANFKPSLPPVGTLVTFSVWCDGLPFMTGGYLLYYYDPNGTQWSDDRIHDPSDVVTFYNVPSGGYLSCIPYNSLTGAWGEQAYSVVFLAENGRSYKYDVAGRGVYYA